MNRKTCQRLSDFKNYIYSICEVEKMFLDAILSQYSKCKRYNLNNDVGDYIKYIDEERFYIPPSFSDVKTNIKNPSLKPKFVLFSAPGATGKSSLAKYISNRFNAIYWNLAKVKIGTNSFAGSILNAVGSNKYSEFINDLNTGNVLLVIDAFDEAEIISGRKMINSFILEISNSLFDHKNATVFLLARTETAQSLASFCADNGISVAHYEIGFFVEESAKNFIIKSISGKNKPSTPDVECANTYYDVIKRNITEQESISFLGYAPVLQAISTHIKDCKNRQKMISELSTQKDCVSIIIKIMEDLLHREQIEKVTPAFISRCKESHPEFSRWDDVYSIDEQLVRIVYYILFQDLSYETYPLDFLPPQLVDEYQSILNTFLIQHPFIKTHSDNDLKNRSIDFTGPAFRDYSLTRIILNSKYEDLANMYFDESHSKSYFPSQIFFDCYMKTTSNNIKSNHLTYVYDSYRAKSTVFDIPYLQCSAHSMCGEDDEKYTVDFGMTSGKVSHKKDEIVAEILIEDSKLNFDHLINVSINTPKLTLDIGHKGVDTRIYNSSIVCNKINWLNQNVSIESYAPQGCIIVAKNGFYGDAVIFDVVNNEILKINTPNINSYYKLLPYSFDFEDNSNIDITKFLYALRCILVEFRSHRKDTLAKTAERIEQVVVGKSVIKRLVLEYLMFCKIVYPSEHLYKINEDIMQIKGINYNALMRMDSEQMKGSYDDFCLWVDKQNK